MEVLLQFLEALFFVAALSVDSFVACLAYGAERIRIPIRSALIIDLVCAVMLAMALSLGTVVRQFIPADVLKYAGFGILLLLGLFKFFDQFFRKVLRRHGNVPLLLSVYANPAAADADNSKLLSGRESVSIAVALSLDGLAAGFGAALSSANIPLILAVALLLGFLAVSFGGKLGNTLSKKIPLDLSWSGGIVLVILALLKL